MELGWGGGAGTDHVERKPPDSEFVAVFPHQVHRWRTGWHHLQLCHSREARLSFITSDRGSRWPTSTPCSSASASHWGSRVRVETM